MEIKMNIRYAWKRSLPVMAGYIVLGMGFGILLTSKGYSVVWVFLMSLLIYAGSMQYVAVDLLAGGASLISAALMTLMVNARHLFYGISMIDRYRGTGRKKPYLIFSLTDETYSLVCSGDVPAEIDQKKYFFWVSLLDQSYWVIGSTLGGLIGSMLTFNTAGIDFSMTALFIVVFIEQWKSTRNHASALIGVTVSLVCLLIFGGDNFLIPSMAAITAVLTLLRGRLEQKESGEKNNG